VNKTVTQLASYKPSWTPKKGMRVKCIHNKGYSQRYTLGKVYVIEYCDVCRDGFGIGVTSDEGYRVPTWVNRFAPADPPVPPPIIKETVVRGGKIL